MPENEELTESGGWTRLIITQNYYCHECEALHDNHVRAAWYHDRRNVLMCDPHRRIDENQRVYNQQRGRRAR